MNDDQLLRYSRQILLPNIGIEGQEKLLAATVLIIGAGGLGSPVALYLAAAGVGHLMLSDFDTVDITNLQRQIIHSQADIGRPKVESAHDRLLNINNTIGYTLFPQQLQGDALHNAVSDADAVVDCSDNFATRFALNEACHQHSTPLISAAVIRMEGQIGVFDFRDSASPCYRCLYQAENSNTVDTCSENGILAPVAGMIGSMQAIETLKLLTGLSTLVGQWLIIDALYSETQKITVPKNPDCPVCANKPRDTD